MVGVRHRGGGWWRSNHLIAVLVAALVFLATATCAAVLLPGRVHLYYTPTDRPDVVYELWQYLFLVVVGAAAMALAAGATASALVSLVLAFGRDGSDTGVGVAAWAGAWTLLWFSAALWLTIWLGNDHPLTRSWLELLLALVGLTGAGLIVGWRAWDTTRRGA